MTPYGVLRGHEDDPGPSVLALRLMGAVHRLVLRGDAPELVENPVQTNEPGRCVALLGGFLEVAHTTGLPLRLLEVGASAGLNLRFDRYRYQFGDERWGPPDSTVAGRLTLTSYVWPDQLERLERLRAALAVAHEVDAPVERAGAAELIEARLAEPAPATTATSSSGSFESSHVERRLNTWVRHCVPKCSGSQ